MQRRFLLRRPVSCRAFAFAGLIGVSLSSLSHGAGLEASDGDRHDFFGFSVSLSGTTGLVGALFFDDDNRNNAGSAYLFHGLDSVSGTVNQNAKLLNADGREHDRFGFSVSLSGGIGLVGACPDNNEGNLSGPANVFRGLDTATGTVKEVAKLAATDGAADDWFGKSVSLSGSLAIVGARQDDDMGKNSGSVYLFRGLETAIGTVNESAKLQASDGVEEDWFGGSVSLSGSNGLIGGPRSAYLFRGLDSASGRVNESAKLLASDGALLGRSGDSVSLSGHTGLVGAYADDDNGSNSGSAYLFQGLDTAAGTVNETVKLLASNGTAFDQFGGSVALDRDLFLIGAAHANAAVERSGKAYSGGVSAVTKLDEGEAERKIFEISSFLGRTGSSGRRRTGTG